MKRPIARPTATTPADIEVANRAPRAFAPAKVAIAEPDFDPIADETLVAPPPRRMGWVSRLAWTAGGLHRAGSKLGIHTSHRAEARPAHPAHRQHPSGDP